MKSRTDYSEIVAAVHRLGTYQAVATQLGVTRERVRQIVRKQGIDWGAGRSTLLWCHWPRRYNRLYDERYQRKFWSQTVQDGECRLWTGNGHPNGYGQVAYRGRQSWAHRIAWLLAHGSIPKGLCVLHKCDNPPCVNPDHLWLGTKADNARDRARKGRNQIYELVGTPECSHPERKRYARGACQYCYSKWRQAQVNLAQRQAA